MRKHSSRLEFLGGVPIIVPNRTDEVDTGSPHRFISYNSRDRNIYGSDTTALVLGSCECFLILKGDHREGFQAAIQSEDLSRSSLNKCLAYVREHRDKLSDYSDPII